MQIIVKSYNHLNKAFPNWDTPEGVLVKNKDHYDRLMKENNMIPYDQAVDDSKNGGLKGYTPSKKALEIIKAAKNSKDKNGNVKLSDRTIDAMRDIGAIGKEVPSYMQLPSHYQKQGGFSK